LCELQRDWAHKETVLVFTDLFIETGGTAGIEFAYDKAASINRLSEKNGHQPGRSARRSGHIGVELVMGGRRVSAKRPRLRRLKKGWKKR
jgi:hypothetical protein